MSSNKSILGIGNSQKRSNNFNNKERKKLIFKAQEVDSKFFFINFFSFFLFFLLL